MADQTASANYFDTQGYRYSNLQYQQLAYSPAVTNASCIFYSFGSNYSTLDAYLTTQSNLESMLTAQASHSSFCLDGPCKLTRIVNLAAVTCCISIWDSRHLAMTGGL